MACGSVHSTIERSLKNTEIYLPSDYVKITKSARKNPSPYESINLEHTDFYDFKNLNLYKFIRAEKVKGDPEIRDIRTLKYDPIHKKFFIKSTLMMIIKNYQIITVVLKKLILPRSYHVYTKVDFH